MYTVIFMIEMILLPLNTSNLMTNNSPYCFWKALQLLSPTVEEHLSEIVLKQSPRLAHIKTLRLLLSYVSIQPFLFHSPLIAAKMSVTFERKTCPPNCNPTVEITDIPLPLTHRSHLAKS